MRSKSKRSRAVNREFPSVEAGSPLFVVGPPGSGKSAVYERALGAFECRLYFGTALGAASGVHEMIAAHRARRGAGWRLVETQGAANDIDRLHETLDGLGAPSVCMIDGLTNWVFAWTELAGGISNAAHVLAQYLVDIVNEHPESGWCLLDVPPSTYAGRDEPARHACDVVAGMIKSRVRRLRVFDFEPEIGR